jgi:hypothetical protein
MKGSNSRRFGSLLSGSPSAAADGCRPDFRFIPFGFIVLYVLALVLSERFLGSYVVVGRLFRIHAMPYFVDLQVLLCGVDAVRNHADPYMVPCFQGKAIFNYPYSWGVLSLLPFLNEANHIPLGFVLAFVLFVSLYFFVGSLTRFEAFVYTSVFLSPAFMLGVERGNCDLLIFLLLLVPLAFRYSRPLFAFAILAAAALKFYPIGALGSLLVNKKSRWFVLPLSVLGLFLVYLAIMKGNLSLVMQKTPKPFGDIAYGLGTIPWIVASEFGWRRTYATVLFCLLAGAGLVVAYVLTRKRIAAMAVGLDRKGVAYLMGSGIFITTCLIGGNWEYRLIFLALTMPQTLDWIRARTHTLAGAASGITIAVLWETFLQTIVTRLGMKAWQFHLFSGTLVILLFYFHALVSIGFLRDFHSRPVGAPKQAGVLGGGHL